MVLIHDIVEIDADDTFIYDQNKDHDHTEEELKSAERIFGILPQKQALEFIEIVTEFEDGESDESKFAKAIDRLEPLMQNTSNNGIIWKKYGIKHHTVRDKKINKKSFGKIMELC